MKCEAFEKEIIDYLDGTLDKESLAAFTKHMESCERCRDEVRDFQEIMTKMSASKEIVPDESLQINFYHMLHKEIRKQKGLETGEVERKTVIRQNQPMFSIAAGIALFVLGTLTGVIFFSGINRSQERQLSQLRNEVNEMKKTAMLTLLKDNSSSERLQAITYADQFETPDQNVIAALIKTLNTDKNVNVRMAAAYALDRYANLGTVRDSLVRSLSLQDNPIVQVTLINILVERQVKEAIPPMNKIIMDHNTLDEVKYIAEKGKRSLI